MARSQIRRRPRTTKANGKALYRNLLRYHVTGNLGDTGATVVTRKRWTRYVVEHAQRPYRRRLPDIRVTIEGEQAEDDRKKQPTAKRSPCAICFTHRLGSGHPRNNLGSMCKQNRTIVPRGSGSTNLSRGAAWRRKTHWKDNFRWKP